VPARSSQIKKAETAPAAGRDTRAPYADAILKAEKAERKTMTDHDPQDLANARKVLVEMRYNWIKQIAGGTDTENAIKRIVEVQQAIDVIDHAIDEFEEEEVEEEEEE
jgi:hypothetical protein